MKLKYNAICDLSAHGAHVHGVAAQNSQERGEFLQMAKRILGADLGHGSLKIYKEEVIEVLGAGVVAVVNHAQRTLPVGPALDLGQIDVAQREHGQRLEEHAGLFGESADDAGLELAVGARDDGLARQHEEARDVVGVVLDAIHENFEPVDLRGARACDGAHVAEVVRRDELRGAGGVVDGFASDAELGERPLALRERLRVADHALQVLLLHAGDGHEAVVHGELHLADDVQAVAQQQVVVAVDAAAQGVLDGQDGSVREPELHGRERRLELLARDGLAARVGFRRSSFAVRAGHSLVCHSHVRAFSWRKRQLRYGQWLR